MKDSALHIMIIWSKATDYKAQIIDQLDKEFHIYKIFKISWSKTKFIRNLSIFYSHSLRDFTDKDTSRILWRKLRNCGCGDFYAIVFEDKSPIFEERKTTSGVRLVNTNVFDLKTKLRKIVGGGSRIHASDDEWETNKDLTILFGLNSKDFITKYCNDGNNPILIKRYKHNCIGAEGYPSINKFFYVLNNCIRYCVLRNFECLPDQYTVEGHGDIDLLVESKRYIARLVAAHPSFPQPYRVYHTVKIAGNTIPFDFRSIGDNYYDYKWEQNILDTRVLKKELFYTPNEENHYYTLLYHAFVQKRNVNSSYPPVLDRISKSLGIVFQNDGEFVVRQLDTFLSSKRYSYTKANDESVYLNKAFLSKSQYYKANGCSIKVLLAKINGEIAFRSSVNELNDCFVKKGEFRRIENEREKLIALFPTEGIPVVLESISNQEMIRLSKIEGTSAFNFWKDSDNYTFSMINSFVTESFEIINKLRKKKIFHRDFMPTNILVKESGEQCQIGLIDFGWAIFDSELDNSDHPNGLCRYMGYEYGGNYGVFSDYYSLGKIVERFWFMIPYYRRFARMVILAAQERKNEGIAIAQEYLNGTSPNFCDRVLLSVLKKYVLLKFHLKKKNLIYKLYIRFLG